MDTSSRKFESVDGYIASFPPGVQSRLKKMRGAIRAAAPTARETISYGMPAFRLNGPLVYFAAFRDHISFFPTSSGIIMFQEELSTYETSKATVRFPMDEPIPFDLVKRIVEYRVKENLGRGKGTACRRPQKPQR